MFGGAEYIVTNKRNRAEALAQAQIQEQYGYQEGFSYDPYFHSFPYEAEAQQGGNVRDTIDYINENESFPIHDEF